MMSVCLSPSTSPAAARALPMSKKPGAEVQRPANPPTGARLPPESRSKMWTLIEWSPYGSHAN